MKYLQRHRSRATRGTSSKQRRRSCTTSTRKETCTSTPATCSPSTQRASSTSAIESETLLGERFASWPTGGTLEATLLLRRWKGENVSTAEVADVLTFLDCIKHVTVYGVDVPGDLSPRFDLQLCPPQPTAVISRGNIGRCEPEPEESCRGIAKVFYSKVKGC